jgi:hypothetical protein
MSYLETSHYFTPRIIVVEAVEQILKSKRNGWAKIIGENARNM